MRNKWVDKHTKESTKFQAVKYLKEIHQLPCHHDMRISVSYGMTNFRFFRTLIFYKLALSN